MSARLRQAAVQAHKTLFLLVRPLPCWIASVAVVGVPRSCHAASSLVDPTGCSTSVSSRYSLVSTTIDLLPRLAPCYVCATAILVLSALTLPPTQQQAQAATHD